MPFTQRKTCSVFACLFICMFVASAVLADEVNLPVKENFHIFLLMGQSNMAGSGKPIPAEYQKPHPRVMVLGKDGKWIQASTPLDSSRKGWGGINPGQSFARAYADLFPEGDCRAGYACERWT